MHRVGAAHRGGRGLAQAEIAYLAGLHQLGHRADGFFDGYRLIDAMLVVKVDHVDAEALERSLARLFHVVRPAVDADPRAVLVALIPELGGEEDLVTLAGDRFADEHL